jgi:hypothetical protein
VQAVEEQVALHLLGADHGQQGVDGRRGVEERTDSAVNPNAVGCVTT